MLLCFRSDSGVDLHGGVVSLWHGGSDLEGLWSARLPLTVASWDRVEVLWENVVDLVISESVDWVLVADVQVTELPVRVKLDAVDGHDCH